MRIVSYADFERPDGSIDWARFYAEAAAARALDVNDGVYCAHCGAYMVSGRGYPQTCLSCRTLASESEEVSHETFIRCPNCGNECGYHKANVSGRHGLLEAGDHDVICNECRHRFTVHTSVSYRFTSPARLPKEEPQE